MLQDGKKYSWFSYTSFGLGILSTVITLGLITGIALFLFIGFIWLITPDHPT